MASPRRARRESPAAWFPSGLPFNRAEGDRLLRFVTVGASNTALTLAVYTIGIALGVWYPLAGFLGYAAGILNGYTWNRRWTFETGSFHFPEFSRYVLVHLCGLSANLLGLLFAVETLGLGKLIAEIAVLAPIALCTYLANRWWTFEPRAGFGARQRVPRPTAGVGETYTYVKPGEKASANRS